MANEVMSTLFGVTPEALMAQRSRQDLAQGTELAQLNPFQQAYANIYAGSAGLGRSLGGLLGAEDPELVKARKLNEISRQFDLTSIEGAKNAVRALSEAGYSREALALNDRITQMRKAEADILKASRPNLGTQTERARLLISQAETKLAKGEELSPEESSSIRWLVAQETKPKAFRDADSGELITIQPLDIEQAAPNIARFLKGSAKTDESSPLPVAGGAPTEIGQTTSPAPGITVTKVGEGKGLDASTRKELATVEANITKLNSSVSRLSTIDNQINTLNLGLLENWARGGLASVGLSTKDRTTFDSLKRTMLAEANNLLLLAKGAQTEGDAQRARDQIADENTWKNKDALKQAFADLRRTHQETISALKAQKEVLDPKGKSRGSSAASQGQYSQAQEALISRWMAANKRSRDEVISYLKSQGKL